MMTTRWIDTTRLTFYSQSMYIELTPAQQAFAREAVASGRLHAAEDAVHEALILWESRERARSELLVHLDALSASTSQGTLVTAESMRAVADSVKRRGRERLASETSLGNS